MPTRTPRRRTVTVGGVRALKIGTPPASSDLYYATMEMSWPGFVALVSLVFLLINVAFGLLYAALPGAIGNAAPGSIADGFFFSVETLGTVGYGNMAPATHLGHSIAAVEILLGLFYSATITGLTFARFARPRSSFAFARVAVVNRTGGQPRLKIRVASTRMRPIADVTAQLAWLEQTTAADGRMYRQLADLPLVRSHNPQLAFAWVVVHEVEQGSPMYAALTGDGEFRLRIAVSGTDTLLASQALGGQMYGRADIKMDYDFDDMIAEDNGQFEVDLTKLDDIRPVGVNESPVMAA